MSVKAEHSQQVCRVKDDNGGIFSAAREGRIREGELGFLDLFFSPSMDLLLRDEPVTLSLSLCRPLVVELILPPLQIFGQMSDQETLFFPLFSFKVLIPMSLPPSLSLSFQCVRVI